MTSPSPVVGDWYRRPDGALFEVVAIDRDDGTVEVQHFDGTLEEFDLESWDEQEFEEAQAPEDWTGSVDVEPEDYEAEREVEQRHGCGPIRSRVSIARRPPAIRSGRRRAICRALRAAASRCRADRSVEPIPRASSARTA